MDVKPLAGPMSTHESERHLTQQREGGSLSTAPVSWLGLQASAVPSEAGVVFVASSLASPTLADAATENQRRARASGEGQVADADSGPRDRSIGGID